MRPIPKLVPAIVGLLVLGGGVLMATLGGSEPSDIPPGLPGFSSYVPIAGCVEELPVGIREPQFRPDTLTLPEGSEAIRTSPDPAPGLHVVVYRVPTTLDGFVEHVLAEWEDNGWILGRGERETGEAESVYYLPDKSRYGQFRARSVFCDLAQTEVTLTLGEDVSDS